MRIFLLAFLFSISAQAIKVTGALTKPVYYAAVSATITTSAWTELTSSTAFAASGMVASNATGSYLILGRGVSGTEVSSGFVIPPGEVGILVPIELRKGERLSLKSLFTTASGTVGISFFQ